MLEAERALSRVQELAAAFGSMEERDQKQYLRSLQRTAAGGKAPSATRPTAASLAQMGITVEDIPAPSEEVK
jgi:hypothetical protein